jgi:molybdate-binding protein
LALARAFDCRVEDLFSLADDAVVPAWAWPPKKCPARLWSAEVAGRHWYYPAETSDLGVAAHDGVYDGESIRETSQAEASKTLVIACCDPAIGVLAEAMRATSDCRPLVFSRSSGQALDLLRQGLVHVAGIHLAHGARTENAAVVKDKLGGGYSLVRVARWQEGLALDPKRRLTSVRGALSAKLRWVGRESGSGARQCLDEILGERTPPKHLAREHRGVADAIRTGLADAGVCLRFVSEEAGLDFIGVREEAYDLCFATSLTGDPRIQALLSVLRSVQYRQLLGELPGYDSSDTGAIQHVK